MPHTRIHPDRITVDAARSRTFSFRPGRTFAGFDSALAEMRAGQKQGHWIWYVFPQLAGLGSSRLAQVYGIDGRAEAIDYLRDPILG